MSESQRSEDPPGPEKPSLDTYSSNELIGAVSLRLQQGSSINENLLNQIRGLASSAEERFRQQSQVAETDIALPANPAILSADPERKEREWVEIIRARPRGVYGSFGGNDREDLKEFIPPEFGLGGGWIGFANIPDAKYSETPGFFQSADGLLLYKRQNVNQLKSTNFLACYSLMDSPIGSRGSGHWEKLKSRLAELAAKPNFDINNRRRADTKEYHELEWRLKGYRDRLKEREGLGIGTAGKIFAYVSTETADYAGRSGNYTMFCFGLTGEEADRFIVDVKGDPNLIERVFGGVYKGLPENRGYRANVLRLMEFKVDKLDELVKVPYSTPSDIAKMQMPPHEDLPFNPPIRM